MLRQVLAIGSVLLVQAQAFAAELPALPTVDLAEALRRAATTSPQSMELPLILARAEALVSQARAGLFPTLTGNAVYTRLDGERTLATGSSSRVVAGQDQIRADLQAVVPLLSPAVIERRNRAEAEREATRASATEIRRQVAVATARAFLAVVSNKRVVEVAERARLTAARHQEFALARLQGGVGRSLDEVRALQELSAAEGQVETSAMGLARAREALGLLLGADGPVDAHGEGDVEAVAGAKVPSVPVQVEAADRPDLLAAKGRTAVVERAKKDRWTHYAPYLALIGTPYYQKPASLVNPELGWQAQLVLTLPIWDGGRRGTVFAEQDAALTIAKLEEQIRGRQVAAEVRVGFEILLHSDRALAAARKGATAARTALELAELAYTAGATSNIEVVDAERRARDAETAAAVAEDAARLARLDLLTALGRFPGPAR